VIDYTGTIWVSGEWRDANKPALSAFDHGVLYGDGVYDTLFAMDGMVFKIDAHLDRLWRSLQGIDLTLPFSREQVRAAALETIALNDLQNAYVKIVATRGLTAQPLLNPAGNLPTLIIFARPYLHLEGGADEQKGLTGKIVSVRRVGHQSIDPRIKNLNYLNLILAQMEAAKSGSDEALMMDDRGYVCEGPGYNIFVVSAGVLRTPRNGILEGITRATVIELAREADIPVEVEDLTPFDLFTADEVFLSSTAGGLMPIVDVDGRRIGTGTPGHIFQRIFGLYERCVRSGRHGTRIPAIETVRLGASDR
jgi:branched-chain amino acid aminotransferase